MVGSMLSLLLLFCGEGFANKTSVFGTTKLIIVGAGMSGLAAAETLIQHGFHNILILEATDRIGGRICTDKFGDGWVERGAQWIHGEVENPAYEYALLHDLIVNDTVPNTDAFERPYFLDNGLEIDPPDEGEKFEEKFMDSLDNCDNETFGADPEEDLDTYLNRVFQEELNESQSKEELMQKRGLLQTLKHGQCLDDGCDSLAQLNCHSITSYKECEGSQLVNFKNGYMSLVNTVASTIPSDKIALQKPVTKIEILSKTEDNSSTPGGNRVKVTCLDGTEHTADHVLFTPSLGYLKEHAASIFSPLLSPEKMDVIQKLGFGTVAKIFLEFETAFWPTTDPGLGYQLVWRALNETHPLEDGGQLEWYHSIPYFITAPFASNVLVGWLHGEGARHMENLTDAEVQSTCVTLLQRFTGIKDLPPVKAMTRSKWYRNPYTRGTYSFLTKESKSNEALAEPVYITKDSNKIPVILFAGEATHPFFFSTVHGAMDSGRREATRLLSHFSQKI